MAERKNIKLRLREGIWQDSIPSFGPTFEESESLDIQGSTWTDIREKVSQAEQAMACISYLVAGREKEIIAPVSISRLNTFLDTLEQWVQDNEDNLTIPSTKQGWSKAIQQTLEKEDLDTFALLCGAYPNQVQSIVSLDTMPSNKIRKWWATFNNEVKEELKESISDKVDEKAKEFVASSVENEKTQSSEPEVPKVNEIPDSLTPNKPEYKPFKKPDAVFKPSAAVLESEEKIKGLIKEINSSDKGSATRLIDHFCHEAVRSKNAEETTVWFSKVFMSSLSRLDEQDINLLVDNWPQWRNQPPEKRPFKNVDAENVIGDAVFWSALKDTQKKVSYQQNQRLCKEFVPTLLDISMMSFDAKMNVGKKMFKFAEKNEDIFRNRFNLWSGMGGSLTEQKHAEREDVYQVKKDSSSESMIKWISEQKNEKWDNVIIEYAKDKNLNLYKWYPDNFSSDDLLDVYQPRSAVSAPKF
ncbi:hypothetical protein [Serratia sp. Se-RSBMAAmG]|uniref:hypothetical protein n=1 Tax=Serratia sp. Se-RSBMAAmG TaxID=3043305 RepID=UPI0024AF1719|nr:hypothetical protein [Serratia sp. Se-RSBMAAmG]MDI6976628.1 hypothetical protein [Serratia sp. Se-RSBMAAmG]